MVNAAIRLQNLSETGGRVVKFSLPIAPAFTGVSSNEAMAIGTYVHHNVDAPPNGTVMTAVYINGVVEGWEGRRSYNNNGGPGFLSISETGDIISFTATYEVA